MVTWRELLHDVLEIYKQSFDDAEISISQIAYWAKIISDRLLYTHISKRFDGDFLREFEVPVMGRDTGFDGEQAYFSLPQAIYDFKNERGIEYITYQNTRQIKRERATYIQFTRTKPSLLPTLYMDDFLKPSSANPYYYRVGDEIRLLGVECSIMSHVKVGLHVTASDLNCIDLDDPVDIPAHLVSTLQRELVDMGRFAMLTPGDSINDGEQSVEGTRVGKVISVQQTDLASQAEQQQFLDEYQDD